MIDDRDSPDEVCIDAGVSLTFLAPGGQGKVGGGFHMVSIKLLYKFPKYRQGIRPE